MTARPTARPIATPLARPVAGSGEGGGVSPLILDTFAGALVGFSMRKLRTAYSGAALRVRRSSDNTEQDIGFAGVAKDSAGIASFIGAGDGFASALCDQSENAKNVAQSTTTRQPIVAASGVVGDIEFDGVNDFVSINDAAVGTNGTITISAWINQDVSTGTQTIAASTTGSSSYYIFVVAGGRVGFWQTGAGVTVQTAVLPLTASWNHVAVTRSGSAGNWTISLYVNGSLSANTTTATNSDGSGAIDFAIGRVGTLDTWFFDGKMRDIIMWPTALSAANIAALYAMGSE